MDLILPENFFEKFAASSAKWAEINVSVQTDLTGGEVRKEMLAMYENALNDAWRERFLSHLYKSN